MVALSTNPAISKIYEYKNYLEDNNIQPLVKSSEENSVDIIEFSSFSCSHCAAFHNETLKELKESSVYKNINFYDHQGTHFAPHLVSKKIKII